MIKKPTATGPIQISYIYTDHLNTSRLIVNTSNTPVWRWDNVHAFGANLSDEDPDGNAQLFEYNPRFPGQYFDKETGLHYNYFRYYEPETGRYISPDPIGLAGGINVFGYVEQNPLSLIDPTGKIVIPPALVAGALIGGISGGFGAAANGGNIVSGALMGAVVGGSVGKLGQGLGASLLGQSFLRAGAGALGNFSGQKINNSSQSVKFNYGSFSGSIIGGLFGGFYAPATWGVVFNGSPSWQITQRLIAGIAGAGVTSTSNIVGTKLGECK